MSAADLAADPGAIGPASRRRLRVRVRARITDLARASRAAGGGGSARPIDKGGPCADHSFIVNQSELALWPLSPLHASWQAWPCQSLSSARIASSPELDAMPKLSPAALRAAALAAVSVAREALATGECVAYQLADDKPRWESCHPIDIALDSVDWHRVKKGQRQALAEMIRTELSGLDPRQYLQVPAPCATELRLIGPRGGPVAHSQFYRGPHYWQWVAFDRSGRVFHVHDMQFIGNAGAALWGLRTRAASMLASLRDMDA